MKFQRPFPSTSISRLTPLLIAGLLSACVVKVQADPPRGTKDQQQSQASGEKLRDLRHKLETSERAMHHAQTDLELAKLGEWLARKDAEIALHGAEVALVQATKKRERFAELERAQEEEVARMALDRSAERLIGAQQDLQGILDIYEQEEEARSRDEIIRRHRMSVAFAERGKLLSASRLRVVLEHELPGKEFALEQARVRASQALEALQHKRGRFDLEQEQKMRRKHEAIAEARYALEAARRKLRRAQRNSQEGQSGDEHAHDAGAEHEGHSHEHPDAEQQEHEHAEHQEHESGEHEDQSDQQHKRPPGLEQDNAGQAQTFSGEDK